MRKTGFTIAQGSLGATLVEILVVFGLLGMVTMGIISLQSMSLKSMTSNRQISSRDSLKALADRYALDSNVVGKSAAPANYTHLGSNKDGNQALDYCMNGTPTAAPLPACAATLDCCKAVTAQPFALLDPSDPTYNKVFSGTDAAASPWAATQAAPARYDLNGGPCASAGPTCPLELVTTFTATCAGGAPKCAQADQVLVSYTLRGAPGVQPAGGTPFKAMTSTPVLLTSAAGGGGGGGVVVQMKCAFIAGSSTAGAGLPRSNCTPGWGMGISCGQTASGANGATSTGNPDSPCCVPVNCPAGFTDSGTLSMEGVSISFTGGGGGGWGNAMGNCVRTCTK